MRKSYKNAHNEIFFGSKGYRECKNCVMDTTDGSIKFDENGICNYCASFNKISENLWSPNEKGRIRLEEKIEKIKFLNKNKKYDCILGLSGGIDSSYLALVLKRFDLRVLAVHIDAGWNSEIAVSNIKAIVEHCNFDLYTYVVDWETMKNLQLAFFESGVSNLDVPQDHIFASILYKTALKNNITVFMNGGNIATEYILPSYWQCDAMDSIFIKDIFFKHGKGDLKKFNSISFFQMKVLFRLLGFKQFRPLNLMPYGVNLAKKELRKIGFKEYRHKHGESIFTKFFQNYFLIERYGYDKRRPHFSSRILSGDLKRLDAQNELRKTPYEHDELREDKMFIAKKLNISVQQLDNYLTYPKRSYLEYRNWDKMMRIGQKLKKFLSK